MRSNQSTRLTCSGILSLIVLIIGFVGIVFTGGDAPNAPESKSLRNRLAKWAAGWVIDRTISEPTPETPAKFLSGPPVPDPSCLTRSMGDNGEPLIDNSKGW